MRLPPPSNGTTHDLTDAPALEAMLNRVQVSIVGAEDEVVAAMRLETGHDVAGALVGADGLHSQLSELEARIETVDLGTFQDDLYNAELRIPALSRQLTDARASHALLRTLANVHEWCSTLAASSTSTLAEAGAAAHGLHAELAALRAHPQITGTSLLEELEGECARCDERLRERAHAAWEAAALGYLEGADEVAGRQLRDGAHTLRLDASAPIAVLVSTLGSIGCAAACVDALGDAILSRLVRPLLAAEGAACVKREGRPLGVVVLAIVHETGGVDAPHQPPRDPPRDLPCDLDSRLDRVCDALSVIVACVCAFLDGSPVTELGKQFWEAVRVEVCDGLALPAVTAHFDAGSSINALAARTAARIAALRSELGATLAAAPSGEHKYRATRRGLESLVEATANLEHRAAKCRCEAAVRRARDALLDRALALHHSHHVQPGAAPWSLLRTSDEAPPEVDGGAAVGEAATKDGDTADAGPTATAGQPPSFGTMPLRSLRIEAGYRVSAAFVHLVRVIHQTMEDACHCGAEVCFDARVRLG